MTIERWHPFKELETMRREMDRLWEEFFPTTRREVVGSPWRRLKAEEGVAVPPVDVVDTGEEILIKAEMPGVDKDHVDISIHDNTVSIKGDVSEDRKYKEEDYYIAERSYRSFSRSINIPVKIDADKVKANLKDGILELHLPKAEETKPRKIKVEAG